MTVALRLEKQSGSGNLTSEETKWVRADLKSAKAAGTDGFSTTFYVFLRGKMFYIYMRHFNFLFKMQSYFLKHNDTFQNSIDVLVPKK